MNAVIMPNLPSGRVKVMIVSCKMERQAINSLESKGIEVITVPACTALAEPVSSHPDMLIHHLGGKKIIVHNAMDCNRQLISKLESYGYEIFADKNKLTDSYPQNILLNSLRVGDKLFCNIRHTHPLILDFCEKNNIRIINIRQGYAKCSACVVSENAIITADAGITAAAEAAGLDVLRINEGHIRLHGYQYGFIGGASAKVDKHTVCFTGNIRLHPDYQSIREFLQSHHVQAEMLCEGTLTDYGSMIPLAEE